MDKRITFEKMPLTVNEMKGMPGFNMKDPFYVAALGVCALCLYPTDKDESIKMINELNGTRKLSSFDIQFIADRFMGKKDYIPRSYFEGANPDNNYVAKAPFTVVVQENPYSRNQEGYITLYLKSGGADSPRAIQLRKTPSTGEWYLWSFEGLLSGIKVPVVHN